MWTLMRAFWGDEQGFLISMEMILIATILVLGLIVGMSCLSSAIVTEFQDLGFAVRSLNQSYYFGGFRGCKSWVPGSSYVNRTPFVNNTIINNDALWDIGIGVNTPSYTPGTVITPGVQSPGTVICPPLTTGPNLVNPNGVIVPGTTVVPCPNDDCAKSLGTPVGPIMPIPDSNIPVTPALPPLK